MAQPKGLGRGLGALLGDFQEPVLEKSNYRTVPLHRIEPNPDQPRKDFDEEALQELSESISVHGLIQPLTVRETDPGYYQIIAGERRWRAARMAGLAEVPAMIIEADDRKVMEIGLIETLQREDLTPMEEAAGYRTLIQEYGLTQEEAAHRVSKSRPAVANAMRLLGLTPSVRKLVEEEKLTAGHARALLTLSPAQQEKAAETVITSALSVRQTEQLVKRLQAENEEKPEKKTPLTVDYVAEAEKELSSSLGRACRIAHGKKKGRVEIEYYGVDDLNTLLEALGKLGK